MNWFSVGFMGDKHYDGEKTKQRLERTAKEDPGSAGTLSVAGGLPPLYPGNLR
jgi:hypothetical protein